MTGSSAFAGDSNGLRHRGRVPVDCSGFERLGVAMLHQEHDEHDQIVWALSLMSLAGEPIALASLDTCTEEPVPLDAAEERLQRHGMVVGGEWISSPDNHRPRYYAPVLYKSRTT